MLKIKVGNLKKAINYLNSNSSEKLGQVAFEFIQDNGSGDTLGFLQLSVRNKINFSTTSIKVDKNSTTKIDEKKLKAFATNVAKLSALLNTFHVNEFVEFTVTPKFWITIKYRNNSYKLQGISKAASSVRLELSELPKPVVSIKSQDFLSIISKFNFLKIDDSLTQNFALDSLHMVVNPKDESILLEAVDGNIFCKGNIEPKSESIAFFDSKKAKPTQFLIGLHQIKFIQNFIKRVSVVKDTTDFSVTLMSVGGNLLIEPEDSVGERLFINLSTTQFMDLSKLDRDESDRHFTVDTEKLISALKRIKLFSSTSDKVELHILSDTLEIDFVNTDDAVEAREVIDLIDNDFVDEARLKYNLTILFKLLSSTNKKNTYFELNEDTLPTIIFLRNSYEEKDELCELEYKLMQTV